MTELHIATPGDMSPATAKRTAGKIETYAKALAEHLGWRAVETTDPAGCWDLVPAVADNPLAISGARLHVRRQWNDPGRVVITPAGFRPAAWDWHRHVHFENAKVTAGLDQPVERTAKRIATRVLPDYLARLRELTAELHRNETDAEQRAEEAASLISYYGGHVADEGTGGRLAIVRPGGVNVGQAQHPYVREIRLNRTAELWGMELRDLPAELAKRVLALLDEG